MSSFSKIVRAIFLVYLALFLFLGDAGYWIFSLISLESMRHELREMMDEHALHADLADLTIPNNAFERGECLWTDRGKEFLYRNEMYDVVETVKKGDSTFYCCFKDTDESNARFIAGRHAADDDLSSPAIRLLDLKIAKEYTNHAVSSPQFTSIEFFFVHLIFIHKNPPARHPTPPPRFS